VTAIARADADAANVSEAERLLLDFVARVTRQANTTRPEHVEALRQAGWSEEQVAEAVYVTALFAFFNRVADAFGIPSMGYLQAGRTTD